MTEQNKEKDPVEINKVIELPAAETKIITTSVPPKKVEEPKTYKYKLFLYLRNGIMRPEIASNVFRNLSIKYGDIMRAISPNKFQTTDEIVESYWALERRMKLEMKRTRKQILDAIEALDEAGVLLKK